MSADVKTLERPCRHLKHGHCSNHFWLIMKKSGKPGLFEYGCILWQAKMEALNRYQEAAWRTWCFGLMGEERAEAIDRILSRNPLKPICCPDFKPISGNSPIQCRYYYMETCLLKYPRCPGHCEEYLSVGDQR